MTTETESRSGRPLFAAAGAVVVVMAAVIGAVVGATGEARGATMEFFGVSLFGMTPVSMAVFGVLVTSAVLALVFGLVSLASRYDTETH